MLCFSDGGGLCCVSVKEVAFSDGGRWPVLCFSDGGRWPVLCFSDGGGLCCVSVMEVSCVVFQ